MSTFLQDRIYACALGVIALVAIVAVTMASIGGGSSSNAQVAAPTATAVAPSDTPVAAPTATLSESLLDARRVLDLKTLSDALATYKQRFGAYPATGGSFTWVCKSGLETGCALAKVKASLPYNDGQFDYMYRSDGTSYTLITRLQTPAKTETCADGDAAAAQLSGSPVYCISLAGGR